MEKPQQHKYSLAFLEDGLENDFKQSYDKSVKVPLRFGIIISILSWYSAIGLIYFIIPEDFVWLSTLTLIYIGSYFGFIVYATYKKRFEGYYHILGAISNAWAGLFSIYFCDQFPNGEHLILPVLIFIIFFGSYMVRLRWIAGFIAALSYIICYHYYIVHYADLTDGQVMLYAFVAWMTLIFAVLAGHVSEANHRLSFIQRKTIREQSLIIEGEKDALLKEVHHRVKNNLQIIVSLMNLQASKITNEEVLKEINEAQDRVRSMSLVHQKMNQSDGFSTIVLNDYLKELIDHLKFSKHVHDLSYDINIDESIHLDIETAIPFGLIINEIVSNYIGHVHGNSDDVSFKFDANVVNNRIRVIYQDNGQGIPEDVLNGNIENLGFELIQLLSEQIDAEININNSGGARSEILLP